MSITRRIRITIAGQVYDVTAELLDDHAGTVQPPAPVLHPPRHVAPTPQPAAEGGRVLCPLSGIVVTVHVEQGQRVEKGDLLVTLEAMKMNTPVWAPQDGVVASIQAQPGARTEEGAVLVTLA
jgi:biotin carboxyl carrier protein